MILGRAIGSVWSTRKEERLQGFKLLVIQHVDLKRQPLSQFTIAVDTVDAGVGDIVLVVTGSSARQTERTKDKPVDATIGGVVDRMDVMES
jgi:microcompartment protein CcmK/EutM